MKRILLTGWLLLCACLSIQAQPAPVIFDTDMGPDYDDVGAIALLHALADSGQAHVLATVASTRYEGVAGVLQVLNTYFKRPGLPIGVAGPDAQDLKDTQHWTDTLLQKYPHTLQRNSEAPGAVEVYRQVLAAQPDKSVTIVTVGFLTNLFALLQSPPDRHSPLKGTDLVQRKVKLLVSMAGRFPAGKEFNIEKDAKAAAFVYTHWPSPVWFSGFEIGEKIKTGLPLVRNAAIQHSPVKDVFRICIPLAKEDAQGRMSWDETAVLVAIRGHQPYYDLQPGRIRVAADGSNTWDNNGKGHFYLKARTSPTVVEDHINRLMQHVPAR